MEEELQRLVLEKADANTIRERAVRLGMRILWQDGSEKILAGQTTLEEVMRVTREG